MPPGEGAVTLRTVVPFPAECSLPSSFPRNDTSHQRRVFPNISRTRRHRGPGSLSSPLLVPGCGLCSVLTRPASQGRHGPARMPPPGLTVKHPGNRHRRLSEAAAPVFSGCDVLDGSDLSRHRPQNCAGKKRSGLFPPSLLLTSLEWDRPPRFRISTIKTNALRFENHAFSRRTTLNCAPAFHALQTALGVARASGCPNDEEPLAGTLCLVEAPPFAAHSRAVTALPTGRVCGPMSWQHRLDVSPVFGPAGRNLTRGRPASGPQPVPPPSDPKCLTSPAQTSGAWHHTVPASATCGLQVMCHTP